MKFQIPIMPKPDPCGARFRYREACGECPKCFRRALKVVQKLKAVPGNELKPAELVMLNFSTIVLMKAMGYDGFRKWLRDEKAEGNNENL